MTVVVVSVVVVVILVEPSGLVTVSVVSVVVVVTVGRPGATVLLAVGLELGLRFGSCSAEAEAVSAPTVMITATAVTVILRRLGRTSMVTPRGWFGAGGIAREAFSMSQE
ncbi:hypothetical protein ACFQYP_00780 [Nonomuraea antimicrobica]